ncbi:MAG: TIGR02186 family protein [Deltaproteobacteria bacterium]|nr:TIGR02186 family protein [Deltaproteobacteria bacterium]
MVSRLTLLLLLSALLWPRPARALSVEPNPVLVDTFFHGLTLHVRGPAEPGAEICVTIAGQSAQEKFNRKGRFGPLWANVGSVTFAGAPRLFFVACSAPVRQIFDDVTAQRELLDLDALVARTSLSPAGADAASLRREYLRLKQSEGVLGELVGAVRKTGAGATAAFDVAIPWPDKAPAGEYTVRVLYVRDRAIVREERAKLEARLVGVPRLVATLAFEHGALYGLVAVVAALALGLVIGLVFKRGGGH